jgi:hypothetical protein
MSQTPEMMEGAPLIRPSSTDHPLYDTSWRPAARSMILKSQ